MKKRILTFLLLSAIASKAQEVKKDTIIESLKETVDSHSEKFNGLDEKLSTMESTLDKVSKLKISGYIQAQYETYDVWNATGSHGSNVAPSGQSADYVNNSFYIRRARVKFTYEPTNGVVFVLQPNFDIDKVQVKDAYVQLTDHWSKTFALWLGQFNRTTYEVEFSSASREFAERTLVTRTLYPSERDQGAKLEADFTNKYNFPLKIQASIFNGNFGMGTLPNQVKDIDNTKDFMFRAVYSLKLPSKGLGIDFGGHGYFGNNKVISQTTPGATPFTNEDNVAFTPAVGDNLKKQWYGAEMQLYYDLLGGMSLKGEYMTGTFSTFGSQFPAQAITNLPSANVNKVRDFQGYYISLVKNVGKSNQVGVRYDVFDPNTKLSGNEVSSASDLKYNNWTFSYQYFFDENIKIQLTYNMPINEKSENVGLAATDYANKDKVDNVFTVRLQARF